MLLNCLFLFFIHLKLELLTQLPASNDEKDLFLFMKNYICNIELLELESTPARQLSQYIHVFMGGTFLKMYFL